MSATRQQPQPLATREDAIRLVRLAEVLSKRGIPADQVMTAACREMRSQDRAEHAQDELLLLLTPATPRATRPAATYSQPESQAGAGAFIARASVLTFQVNEHLASILAGCDAATPLKWTTDGSAQYAWQWDLELVAMLLEASGCDPADWSFSAEEIEYWTEVLISEDCTNFSDVTVHPRWRRAAEVQDEIEMIW